MALSPKNLREMLFIVIGLMIVTIKSCLIVVSCYYMRTKTGQKYSNKGQKYVTFRFNQFDIKNHDVCQVFSQKKNFQTIKPTTQAEKPSQLFSK